MSLVKDIVDYLVAQGLDGGFAMGKQFLPEGDTEDNAIGVFHYGGETYDGEGGLDRPLVQFVVRTAKDVGIAAADDKIHAIWDHFKRDDLAPFQMGSTDVRAIWSRQGGPYFREYDIQDRPIWGLNLTFGVSR